MELIAYIVWYLVGLLIGSLIIYRLRKYVAGNTLMECMFRLGYNYLVLLGLASTALGILFWGKNHILEIAAAFFTGTAFPIDLGKIKNLVKKPKDEPGKDIGEEYSIPYIWNYGQRYSWTQPSTYNVERSAVALDIAGKNNVEEDTEQQVDE